MSSEDDQNQERTPAGDPIYRYKDAPRDLQDYAIGDMDLIAGVEEHLESLFGKVEGSTVLHEIMSFGVHVDVHVIPPNSKLNGWLCVTSGMAQRPMSPPPEVIRQLGNDCRYCELMTVLPPDWPLFQMSEKFGVFGGKESPPSYWPIGWMKFLARFPHEQKTWLWHGHTIPNGDPAEPFPECNFIGSILLPSLHLPSESWSFQAGDRKVTLFSLWPLYQEEMDFKLRHGTDALISKMEAAGVTDMVNASRPNSIKRKKWFGLF